jgi:outer membrane protein OmpA-like peptidoglycan-associated protein
MIKRNNTIFALAFCAVMSLVFTSCSSCNDKGNAAANSATKTVGDAADAAKDAAGDAADKAGEIADDAANAAGDAMDKMETADPNLDFAEGSWAWNIQQYMSSGSGNGSFTLDKITEDKGDLSAEGKEQLDNLAAILKANPAKVIDLKAHSREAKNEIGRKAKQAGTKARALWVQEKLKARGVDGKQINAIGDADATLIEGVAGDDDSQRRLSVTFVQ